MSQKAYLLYCENVHLLTSKQQAAVEGIKAVQVKWGFFSGQLATLGNAGANVPPS